MFGSSRCYTTQTHKVECGYDIITEQVSTGSKGGVETVERKVPHYKNVTSRVPNQCVRRFCPKKDACGTTSESTMKLSTTQSGTGSPNLGLIPTMRPLAP